MDCSPTAPPRTGGPQNEHQHQHSHFSSFLRKKFFRSAKHTTNPSSRSSAHPTSALAARPRPSPKNTGPGGSPQIKGARGTEPRMPNPQSNQTSNRNVTQPTNMQVLEQQTQTDKKQAIGETFGARQGEREAEKRRNCELGNGPCNGGIAGVQQQDRGFRLLRDEKGFACRPAAAALSDEQEEKVREFKKSVRHFKHQLECNYAVQTQTLNQMRLATESLPEEERGHTLQEYIQTYAEALCEHLRVKRTPTGLEQYEFIQTLGHGGFGAVYLVKRKTDGRYFALKQVPKRKVLKASSRERQFAERNFLSACKCPCIVQLHATFQDELFLYQVVEFLQGGSMMHYMHAKQKFPEDVVKLCIAELVLAVKEVHDKNYIHRDIKPDNIVFTRDGHLKLLDFGLAKFAPHVFHFASLAGSPYRPHCCSSTSADGTAHSGMTTASTSASPHPLDPTCNPFSPVKVLGRHLPRTSLSPNGLDEGCCKCLHMQHEEELSGDGNLNRPSDTLLRSICGTPMYTAPEVLRGEGYDHSVDWWSVGVVMFEMLYGGIPFCPPPKYRGDVATFVKVQVTNHALVCPLVCEPENRFKSAAKIMQHPWFDGVDWGMIHRVKSPLCEDTELYAQRHFPLIDSPFESVDSVDQNGSTGGGSDARAQNAKSAVDGAGNKGREKGQAVSRPKPAGASASSEPDLLFSRYEFNRRAIETLPTFSRVLQRNAKKHFNSNARDCSVSPSPSSRSSGGVGLANGAGYAGSAGVSFSPDPKRCELAREEEQLEAEERGRAEIIFAQDGQHAQPKEHTKGDGETPPSPDSAETAVPHAFTREREREKNREAHSLHGVSSESAERDEATPGENSLVPDSPDEREAE
uniref:non-specific serine/threonine protein kinase n=1 Tax=Neospora caninum (strain Liverpool) TaxID=572307 RepID=A0A0F7UGP5_NEOCL|nr:TPA: AGC kinase, putative [Neospora caninum Liverpool]